MHQQIFSSQISRLPVWAIFQRFFLNHPSELLVHAIATLGLMARISWKEQGFQHEEIQYMASQLAEILNISQEEVNSLILELKAIQWRTSFAEKQLFEQFFRFECDRSTRNALLRSLLGMAGCDKALTERECAIILRTVQSIGLSLTEYKMAVLPYTSVLVSAQAGLNKYILNAAGNENVQIYCQNKIVTQELENISLAELTFRSNKKISVGTLIQISLFSYISIISYVSRAKKEDGQWVISLDLDLNPVECGYLDNLLHMGSINQPEISLKTTFASCQQLPEQLLGYLWNSMPDSRADMAMSLKKMIESRKVLPNLIFSDIQAWHADLLKTQMEKRNILFGNPDWDVIGQQLDQEFSEPLSVIIKLQLLSLIRWILPKGLWKKKVFSTSEMAVIKPMMEQLGLSPEKWSLERAAI
ncbi:MAG: TerB family tellurite resistance protein [SAR324 cluster bacterium]|nr:TerB family tellurite resistance protein [SAR324 cluster bacterium]